MENVCGSKRNKIIIAVVGLLLLVATAVIIIFTVGRKSSTEPVQAATTEQITTTTEKAEPELKFTIPLNDAGTIEFCKDEYPNGTLASPSNLDDWKDGDSIKK